MGLTQPLLVPLPTPYTDDTVTLSEVRVARLVRFYRESGADGFVVNSEVGDHLCMSHSERKEMVEFVNRDAAGLPLVVNITAFTTSAMVDLCQPAERHGARAAVYKPPVSLNLTPEELESLARSFRRHTNLNIGLVATPEQLQQALGDRLPQNWSHAIAPAAYEPYALSSIPMTCEFSSRDGVCSPLALFGRDRLEAICRRHADTRSVAEGIWKLAGPIRFARAACRTLPFEVAVGRPPVQELNEAGARVVVKLFDAGA